MCRFLIALVHVDPPRITTIEVEEVEAADHNAAATLAELRWPHQKVSVTKLGRIIGATASDNLAVGFSGGGSVDPAQT